MIDLYCFSPPAREVAQKHSVSLRSVKRLLQKHGVHRRAGAAQPLLVFGGGRQVAAAFGEIGNTLFHSSV